MLAEWSTGNKTHKSPTFPLYVQLGLVGSSQGLRLTEALFQHRLPQHRSQEKQNWESHPAINCLSPELVLFPPADNSLARLGYGLPPKVPQASWSSTILALNTQHGNHLLTHLSPQLGFKLCEGRPVLVLFTALSPVPDTGHWREKKVKQEVGVTGKTCHRDIKDHQNPSS